MQKVLCIRPMRVHQKEKAARNEAVRRQRRRRSAERGGGAGCEEWREQGDEAGEQTGRQVGSRRRQREPTGSGGGGEEERGRGEDSLDGIGGKRWARDTSSPSVWVMVASLFLYCQLSLHFPPFLPLSPLHSLALLTDARLIHAAASTHSDRRREGAQWLIWMGF